VKAIRLDSPANVSRINLELASGETKELWIEADVELATNSDCWVFLLLPIAMRLGENLHIEGTVTKEAIQASNRSQKYLLQGHPNMKEIQLEVSNLIDDSTDPVESSRRVGLFFSGGLDSTFAAETLEDIDTLISVWGFDIPATNSAHWQLTLDIIEPYAKELNKDLVVVKTNIRELSNGLVEWGGDYHGSALAGVSIALNKHLKKNYLAASRQRSEPDWGHSAELANAYTTPNHRIEQTEGIKRIAKAHGIASIPRTTYVRVCYRNVKGLANCATCKKCVRTRLEFDLIKAQYRPQALETRPTFKELLATKGSPWDYLCYLEALTWARQNKFSGTIAPLIAVSIARFRAILQSRLSSN
jgi:7-cyano-7-deazaguanine synthase in queuosine biosynthesis